MPTSWKEYGSSGHRSALFLCCGLFISLLYVNAADDGSTAEGDPTGESKQHVEFSPFYDAKGNIMYFVDREPGALRSYHVQDNKFYGAQIVDAKTNGTFFITFAIPIQGKPNMFVVGLDGSVGVVEWDGMTNATLNPKFSINVLDEGYVNAGSTDANGLLWITVPNPDSNYGSLMWMDSTGHPSEPISVLGLRDKIAFTQEQFFYTNDAATVIYAMDYDSTAKTVSNGKPVFNVTALSLKDPIGGMAFDIGGTMWVSGYFNPTVGFNLLTNEVDGSYPVPDKARFNFVAFGGPNMDVLYGTTNTEAADNVPPLMVANDFKGVVVGTAGVPAKFPITYP